jgi:hypothetical protein
MGGLFLANLESGARGLACWSCVIFLILGATPYLVGMGKTYDAYLYYSFSQFVGTGGHLPEPDLTSSLFYFEWPGLMLTGATLWSIAGIEPEVMVKGFEVVNLAVFGLGIFILARVVFHNNRKAAFSTLLVFLGSTLTFYEFSPNWSTFSIAPLILMTFLQRGRNWRLVSILLYSYLTITHPFNGLVIIVLMSAIWIGQRISRDVSDSVPPTHFLIYVILYVGWTIYVGTFVLTRGIGSLVELFARGFELGMTRVSILVTHVHYSDVVRRLILVVIFGSATWALLVKRADRSMAKERMFSWPTIAALGLTVAVTYLMREAFFWGRMFAYITLFGFLVVASLLTRVLERSSTSKFRMEKVLLVTLVLCLLLMTYVYGASENEPLLTVTRPYMSGSLFLEPSLRRGDIVMAYPLGDIYSVLWKRMGEVQISTLDYEPLLRSGMWNFILVRKAATECYSSYNPDLARVDERVELYAATTVGVNRIYDNGDMQTYVH